MTGHLSVRAFGASPFFPATFSARIATNLLQLEMGFSGLIVTDALNMKAVAEGHTPGEIAVKALLAGHDLLLYGDHIAPEIDRLLRIEIPEAFAAVKEAVEAGVLPEALIDQKVEKILSLKKKWVKEEAAGEPIYSPETEALTNELFAAAMTVLRNKGDLLPLKREKIGLLQLGESPVFVEEIRKRREIEMVALEELSGDLYSYLLLCVSKGTLEAQEREHLIRLSSSGTPVVLVLFQTPYLLSQMPLFDGVLVAYENQPAAQKAAADVLLGLASPRGKLPVSLHSHFKAGEGD